ncbi:MAG: DUF935 domain-containing protein [Proteobacteria bacterium]|nr:DUF935 domain-containing protein [Pseudomonadota bacterium]
MPEVTIYGPDGAPIDRSALQREQAGPMVTGVRHSLPDHPSWGLSPEGLAAILRQSESQHPTRYYALCDDIEEREWHYRGVLSQRRSALAQLPISVDPASDDAEHVRHADFIRSIVAIPDFSLVRMDLSSALGPGMAFCEIDWDTSMGQWKPRGFQMRNLAWFRYDRVDLTTPLVVDDVGQPQPLVPYKWIVHRARLRTGIPVRDGLTRAACWAWMFKNFDIKAWTIFLNKYGHPLRLGKYPGGTKRDDLTRLLGALRQLGTDAAAAIPEGMTIEFIEAAAARGDAFQSQATYLDEQISKLVVGQTGTTDASKGGYAVGRVHDGVRAAISLYDGIVLSSTLNRDLVRPCVDLNFGPQQAYPVIRIGLGDTRDVDVTLSRIGELVDRGLPVEASQVYPLLGLTEPKQGEDVVLLKPATRSAAAPADGAAPAGSVSASANDPAAPAGDSIDALADEMAGNMDLLTELRRQIDEAIDLSTSADDLRARIAGLAKGPASARLIDALATTMFNARLAGEVGAPIGPT